MIKSLIDINLYIGNTANPIVNRSGIVQPWNQHYSVNNSLKFRIKAIYAILTIFKNYISYGNTFNQNIFASEFWYSKNDNFRLVKHVNYVQYFKRFYYSNSILGIEHSFFIRNTTSEFFSFKPWIFFYNDWIVLVVCWFKPPKTKKKSSLKLTTKSSPFRNKTKKRLVRLTDSAQLLNKYKF